jgi:hypothetical protein
MISKSTIAAMVLVAMGLASPAFAQMPPGYGYASGSPGYATPYAYSYEQPGAYRLGTLRLWRRLAARKRC